MGAVSVTAQFPATVHAAQTLWEDTERWVAWVEGLERVEHVDAGWPAAGSVVRWRSGPAGRGRVTEHVLDHERLSSIKSEISDDTLKGVQTVNFVPEGEDAVAVELALDYRIRRRTPLTGLVDLLFVRRAMRDSLQATLDRFGAELTAASSRRAE
jgi:Polyketide cyclase / dehydrase and lipid transport